MITEVYLRYYKEMVMVLPMNDADFIAHLYSQQLLPGDIKGQLESKSTKKDKAEHFLDNVITPAVYCNDITIFQGLLAVMENYGGTVANLAKQIKSKFVFITTVTIPKVCDLTCKTRHVDTTYPIGLMHKYKGVYIVYDSCM